MLGSRDRAEPRSNVNCRKFFEGKDKFLTRDCARSRIIERCFAQQGHIRPGSKPPLSLRLTPTECRIEAATEGSSPALRRFEPGLCTAALLCCASFLLCALMPFAARAQTVSTLANLKGRTAPILSLERCCRVRTEIFTGLRRRGERTGKARSSR